MKGLELKSVFYVQRAHALRGVNFMPAEAYHIRAKAFGRKGQLHKGLYRVRVQQGLGAGSFH